MSDLPPMYKPSDVARIGAPDTSSKSTDWNKLADTALQVVNKIIEVRRLQASAQTGTVTAPEVPAEYVENKVNSAVSRALTQQEQQFVARLQQSEIKIDSFSLFEDLKQKILSYLEQLPQDETVAQAKERLKTILTSEIMQQPLEDLVRQYVGVKL